MRQLSNVPWVFTVYTSVLYLVLFRAVLETYAITESVVWREKVFFYKVLQKRNQC